MSSQLQLCNKTQSVKLKELGFEFDEPYSLQASVILLEHNGRLVCIPTIALALKFMREKYGVVGVVSIATSFEYYYYNFICKPPYSGNWKADKNSFITFEEAEAACLDAIIECVNQKMDDDANWGNYS